MAKKVVAKKRISKSGAGRPTRFKEEYCDMAYRLCLMGYTDVQLAEFFKIAESTLNLWKKSHPKFMESITHGKEHADMIVIESLFKGTQDRLVPREVAFKVKSVEYTEKGQRIEKESVEVVTIQETVSGDFRNQQFWLKNRQPAKWRDKQDIDHTTNGENINTQAKDSFELLLEAARQGNKAEGEK